MQGLLTFVLLVSGAALQQNQRRGVATDERLAQATDLLKDPNAATSAALTRHASNETQADSVKRPNTEKSAGLSGRTLHEVEQAMRIDTAKHIDTAKQFPPAVTEPVHMQAFAPKWYFSNEATLVNLILVAMGVCFSLWPWYEPVPLEKGDTAAAENVQTEPSPAAEEASGAGFSFGFSPGDLCPCCMPRSTSLGDPPLPPDPASSLGNPPTLPDPTTSLGNLPTSPAPRSFGDCPRSCTCPVPRTCPIPWTGGWSLFAAPPSALDEPPKEPGESVAVPPVEADAVAVPASETDAAAVPAVETDAADQPPESVKPEAAPAQPEATTVAASSVSPDEDAAAQPPEPGKPEDAVAQPPEPIKPEAAPAQPDATLVAASSASPDEAEPKPATRSAALDNLKVLLVLLVVEQHVLNSFSTGYAFGFNFSIKGKEALPGTDELPSYSIDNDFAATIVPWLASVNQSFILLLFFFVSGFFNPGSLDRKGWSDFLKDKFIRLGIPCLFWHFIMGPVWAYLKLSLLSGFSNPMQWYADTYAGVYFQVGPPWFLLWLLNFHIFYSFVDGAVVQVPFPGVGACLIFAFAVGVFESVVPRTEFLECPLGLHSLPAYAAFFMFGILAKRGSWTEAISQLSERTVLFLRGLALLCALTMYLAKSSQSKDKILGNLTSDQYLATEGFVNFLAGFQGVVISVVLLHLCLTVWTETGPLTDAVPAAYTVFLIHPFFVIYGLAAYTKVLQVLNVGVDTFAGTGSPGYIADSTNVGYMWLGFAFTSVFCLLAWPASYTLAKMPVLRNIL